MYIALMSEPAVSIHDSFAYEVHRCARVLRVHLMGRIDALGMSLTPEQWFILNKLDWQDGRTQRELVEDIFQDQPNITRIVASLEKQGLVVRRSDPVDGRAKRVFLSRAGKQAATTLGEMAAQERGLVLQNIDPQELAIARKVLAQLESNCLE